MAGLDLPNRYNVGADLLERNLKAGREGKVAIHSAGGDVTYGELFKLACGAARTLTELGVRREERVLIVAFDSPGWVAAFLGAIRHGAVPVPVNPLLQRSEDYDHFIEDSLARVVVVDATSEEKLKAAAERAAQPPRLIRAGQISIEDEVAAAPTRRDDMAFWLYSSGSTGKPKAVVHLQHDIPYTCVTYAEQVLGITERDTTFSTTGLFHAYGFGNNLTLPYWVGATTVLHAGRHTPATVLETIEKRRPTLFFSAPTLYNAILNFEGSRDRDLSSIRHCVAAAESLPAEVWRRWKDAYGLTILDGVGSTEMLHIYCSNRLDDVRPGSSGKPVPGYELKILDEEGKPVPTGEAGDLYVKGDSALALYWAQHEKTKRSVLGEWFFTGDRYRVDADGYYWYEGRSDDMIKVSGLWASPIEIESVLLEHPAVGESAVVGVEVEGFTRIKAFVIAKDGVDRGDVLVAELQEHCKSKLQRYQYPHLIEFVDELPKTVTGKIQRYKLREKEATPASA
ncbi:MAG: 4-hydroxybenzoate--CoA ligase [Chloroflexi bacterium 13_1_40CM_3_65_12]|nr:MAG: 4-hydroxybenzoate--CoA ligase [Chloroflexi bacterium 13_1_40CM_65_17]OLC66699.1 MAG: 4-hydroxybenzoate--CoA ligase [Actinobacteria bacterium 13_1_40CM_4_65_12]OLD23365.1 MAG: 4-hydroxybenzoate--CoA ligase [Chloroflexi bacterium 13_1_40CM_3_65_12]OLD49753.1 MAG: 4-hydroxybenzoate--CoA ligase [Actinobacteria bacterium 13_1_40CM_2_65_8]